MELRVGGQRKKPKAKQDFGLCVGGQLKNPRAVQVLACVLADNRKTSHFMVGGKLHCGAAVSHHFFGRPVGGGDEEIF